MPELDITQNLNAFIETRNAFWILTWIVLIWAVRPVGRIWDIIALFVILFICLGRMTFLILPS